VITGRRRRLNGGVGRGERGWRIRMELGRTGREMGLRRKSGRWRRRKQAANE